MMSDYNWWKNSVIYEIFPQAFSNEGLKGIERKLVDIKDLGADTLWICPVFMSPFLDAGYDISDYYSINPMFGSMDDFKSLIKSAHRLNMHIILDIALNHTSDSHPWFVDAMKDIKSKYRDYYIFKKGLKDIPPNDWISSKTRKSIWTYNDMTKDYYLHIYTDKQPDLNWANEEVQKEVVKILKYWLNLGVDGFRLDVINKIGKPDQLLVKCEQEYCDTYFENHPNSHVYIKELRKQIKKDYPACFLLGQLGGAGKEQVIRYTEANRHELDSFLQFEHTDINVSHYAFQRPWSLSVFKDIIMKWQNFNGHDIVGTMFMSNHDSARIVSRLTEARGDDVDKAATMLCMFQLCLKGIPIIYMGDELGMTNINYRAINEFKDIRSHDIYNNLLDGGMDIADVIKHLNTISRDNARQFIGNRHNEKVRLFYKKVLSLRNSEKALRIGETILLMTCDDVFAYQRNFDKKVFTIVCNFTPKKISYKDIFIEQKDSLADCKQLDLLQSNYIDSKCDILQAYEGRIYLGDVYEK